MNILWHELKSNYKGLIGWIVGILFLQVSGYSKFQGFKAAQETNSVNAIANSFPKALLALFGMSNLNIASLIGYFGILYIFFALMASIYSGLLGAGIISKEERDKTSEFLYTKPIGRSSVLSAKLLAGMINLLIVFFVISISSVLAVGITNGYNYSLSSQVMSLMWGVLLMQILFYSLGILFASVFQNPKLPIACVTSLIVVGYFASVLTDISTKLEWLRFITPFQWFSAPSIINSGHIAYGYAAVTIITSIIFLIPAYIVFNRRDISVA